MEAQGLQETAKSPTAANVLTVSSSRAETIKGVGRGTDIDQYAVEISKAAMKMETAFFRPTAISLTLLIVVVAAMISAACAICRSVTSKGVMAFYRCPL